MPAMSASSHSCTTSLGGRLSFPSFEDIIWVFKVNLLVFSEQMEAIEDGFWNEYLYDEIPDYTSKTYKDAV